MDIEEFANFLKNENKSTNTIKGYIADIRDYNKWFHETFSKDFTIIIRQNILEYKSYLQNIKRNNAKTINHKLSSLLKYNHYLVYKNIQKEIAIENNDKIKITVTICITYESYRNRSKTVFTINP